MRTTFIPTHLAEVLQPDIDAVPVNPTGTYKIAGVYSFGRGLLTRAPLQGSATTYKMMHRLHAGQFVLSQLKAWEGALARVPESLEGWFVSPQFATFRAIPDKLDIRFLEWYCKQSGVWDSLRGKARGMGARRDSVSPERFLELEVPLPSLVEQRRIVARIDELSSKIDEVKTLRSEIQETNEGLYRSIILSESGKATYMREVVRLRECDVTVSQDETYDFAGVYCFGGGVFKGQRKAGTDFAYKRLTRLKAGNFVYPKLMAWEGALGIVPTSCEGRVVSPEFPVFEIDERRVLPETLDVYFRMPSVWPELAAISTGTNVRRRRLHPSAFLNFEMPLPSMETQLRLRRAQRIMDDEMKTLQSETAEELNALMPSILSRAFSGEL
jgi:type I restriction enzyme S subunit